MTRDNGEVASLEARPAGVALPFATTQEQSGPVVPVNLFEFILGVNWRRVRHDISAPVGYQFAVKCWSPQWPCLALMRALMTERSSALSVRVSHHAALNDDIVRAFTANPALSVSLDAPSTAVPTRRTLPKGADVVLSPLAWIVLSIAGTASTIYLKAFLEELGKMTAKALFSGSSETADSRAPKPEAGTDPEISVRDEPSSDIAIVSRVSKYIWVVIRIDEADVESPRGSWKETESQALPLIEKCIEAHRVYYEVWPELEPDPVILEISRFDGLWRLSEFQEESPPYPPFRLEWHKIDGLPADDELRELRARANASLKGLGGKIASEELRRREKELNRRLPPGYLKPSSHKRRRRRSFEASGPR